MESCRDEIGLTARLEPQNRDKLAVWCPAPVPAIGLEGVARRVCNRVLTMTKKKRGRDGVEGGKSNRGHTDV